MTTNKAFTLFISIVVLLFLCGCTNLRGLSNSELNLEALHWKAELESRMNASIATPKSNIVIVSPQTNVEQNGGYGYGSPLGSALTGFTEGLEKGARTGLLLRATDPYNVAKARKKIDCGI